MSENTDIEYKIKVMKAFSEGKKIESLPITSPLDSKVWYPAVNPTWNWDYHHYRVVKEPKYRWAFRYTSGYGEDIISVYYYTEEEAHNLFGEDCVKLPWTRKG